MTPEQKFWQLLKPHIPGHVNRIENSTGVGIPDVNYCYNGQETWLELKAGSQLRISQKIWHYQRSLRAGRVLVIERINNDIRISKALPILEKYEVLTQEEKPWNWEYLEGILRNDSGKY